MESLELHNKLMGLRPQTIPISEFVESGIQFFIPSYQRGYRWESNEIIRLLTDIKDYAPVKDEEFYCLQPVVVRFDKNNKHWILIDGQQRLTTISLILAILEKTPFTISHERGENKSSIEQYYIQNAQNTIEQWSDENLDNDDKLNYCQRLKDRCRIIWYYIGNSSSEEESLSKEHDFFIHLNSGKIALTDAELVKAILLHNLRRDNLNTASFDNKQRHRASQWDLMERSLRNEKFWRFIAGRKPVPSSALDYLLEILYYKYDQSEKDYLSRQNPIFYWIESTECQINDPDELWCELWNIYHRLEGWYNDPVIYNLIGVLSTRISQSEITPKRIVKAIKEWNKSGMTKSKFIIWLKKEVLFGLISKEDIIKAENLTSLSFSEYAGLLDKENLVNNIPSYHNFRYDYPSTKGKVFDFLLVMNITLINPEVTGRRFPFEEFNSQDNVWNIEHISPNNPKNNNALLLALKGMRDSQEDCGWDSMPNTIRTEFEEIIKILDEIDTSDGNEAREFPENPNESQKKDSLKVDSFKENYLPISDNEVMTLGNLTLLTERPNKGIGNNFFFSKRGRLSKYQAEGCFIPPLTLNVFTKWYTLDYDQPLFWRKQNRLEYLFALDKLVASLKGIFAL